MVETQLDRIENMVRLLIVSKMELDGTKKDENDLKEQVKKYKIKKV